MRLLLATLLVASLAAVIMAQNMTGPQCVALCIQKFATNGTQMTKTFCGTDGGTYNITFVLPTYPNILQISIF